MEVARFAIPLNSKSIQSGDISFQELVDQASPVTFRLTNVSSGSTNVLNLITNKNKTSFDHKFGVLVFASVASVELTAAQMASISDDTDGADWDYVEANWTLGAVNTPNQSANFQLQSGHTYDTNGWPPKPKP